VVRGILETNQDRLSNYLLVREGDEVFPLKEATLEIPGRKPAQVASEYLIYTQEAFLIADLSVEGSARRSGVQELYVKKDRNRALLSVRPYVLEGNVHLCPGSVLAELLLEHSRFLPITEATLLSWQEVSPRTFLVNRSKIGFLSAVGDDLTEF
jgi:hypothetical protein